MADSLCWICARAYARPDPYGCAWHRQEHEPIWKTAELKEATYKRKGQPQGIMITTVTECIFFELSLRSQQEQENHIKALQKNAEKARAGKRKKNKKPMKRRTIPLEMVTGIWDRTCGIGLMAVEMRI